MGCRLWAIGYGLWATGFGLFRRILLFAVSPFLHGEIITRQRLSATDML